MTDRPLAGIILAGGEGRRLRALVRGIVGDDRPKQFCPVVGPETLLDQTRRRAELLVERTRLVTVVTAAHERYFTPALRGVAPETIVVQPGGRGTAPAILYAVMRLAALGHEGPVAVFPSDHHVSDDRAFMSSVGDAAEVTRDHPRRIVMLGIFPDRPEAEYGWIEPAERLPGAATRAVYAVRRFWEKPSRAVTERLRDAGALWNSFVLIGERAAFDDLIRRAAPSLWGAFRPLAAAHASRAAADAVYAGLETVDFSGDVLQARPGALGVLPVSGIDWNDLGDPERVRSTQRQLDRRAVTA